MTEVEDVLLEVAYKGGLGPACEGLRREEFKDEELAMHVDKVRRAYKELVACEREMYNFLFRYMEKHLNSLKEQKISGAEVLGWFDYKRVIS
jgi:hypothetical protein